MLRPFDTAQGRLYGSRDRSSGLRFGVAAAYRGTPQVLRRRSARVLRLAWGALLLIILSGCATTKRIPFPVRHGYRFEIDMENAGEITLIGSWNGWQSGVHKMHSWGSYYWLDVDLGPGRYEYVFISTGKRVLPQNAGETMDDGFGGVNAVAVIR